MATNVIMPKLGMTMTEGTIIKWHKKVGDAIEEGMPLFDVETDKLTNTVNANVSGTLLKISVPEDGTADCLAVVAVIGSEGEGMSRLVSERCDFKVSIPMKGSISSLNASAAAAIMLYEAVRQRSLTDT